VKLKRRFSESLNKRRKHTRLIRRDFSQYKIILAKIGDKERKLKGIYAEKKRKRIFITIKKTTRKRKSAKINIKIIPAYLQSKKSRFHYLSSSSDEKADDKIIEISDETSDNDEIINNADNEFFEKFINTVNYNYPSDLNKVHGFDNEADMKIEKVNTEVIKLSAPSRRSVREKKAIRKLLNYYKKIRKGR
jgi:DNA polymerase III epsilon subunit-like protein